MRIIKAGYIHKSHYQDNWVKCKRVCTDIVLWVPHLCVTVYNCVNYRLQGSQRRGSARWARAWAAQWKSSCPPAGTRSAAAGSGPGLCTFAPGTKDKPNNAVIDSIMIDYILVVLKIIATFAFHFWCRLQNNINEMKKKSSSQHSQSNTFLVIVKNVQIIQLTSIMREI